MNKTYPFTELQTKINQAQKILIALPNNPTLDYIASGLSLYLTLKGLGKSVNIICATPMTVEFNNLVGVEQITDKIAGTDLIVNLDYLMDQIEKVSYNDENGKLNLVIQPKKGAPVLTSGLVSFSYAGLSADLVFTIGVKDLSSLQQIGKNDFTNIAIINIDNHPNFSQFGELGIYEQSASCLSEVILGLIIGMNFNLTLDIAQNILLGIWKATGGLTSGDLEADIYESVAICMRAGAKKPLVRVKENFAKGQDFQSRPPVQFRQKPTSTWNKPEDVKPVVSALPNQQVQPVQPTLPPKQNPPADWFEPKIYRGTNIS